MAECTSCRRSLASSDPSLRGSDGTYHLRCAPTPLLDAAAEEHEAIVRKGVRYFVQKYDGSGDTTDDWSARFVALGTALDRERRSRSAP